MHEENELQKGKRDMNPTVADRIRERLEEFTNDLENGTVIQNKYTCRKVEFLLKPKPYSPEAVKHARSLLRASQKVFAMFLGTSVKTVQAWEQGTSSPNKMACRFMDEIQQNPKYWRERLNQAFTAK
jgi:putative transcriptional regulator